ncbi:sugar phosphate isomerase/epimerase family protein [Terriglobus aquaticus]|uniref:Sugar phosphate isomerase/epimerase family protein n=1 Tax=Terriglobus aquaticus TaxID=940139 RepID=A0ABW9KFY7_9BACT|nr:sugar phosphate isomerase/epimerase family protein [Terriglobus aquaticus]
MLRAISTHVFLPQRLHAGLLDALVAGGAQSIELFAARHHFDYTDRAEIKELASWFRSNDCRATLHQPIFEPGLGQWSRHQPATLNLIDPDKGRRITAMDEVKRALETAEQIDIDSVVLHLGGRDDKWNERSLDLSITAIEHIKAFAHPLGVKTLLETLHNDVTTPEHLLEILRSGHFDTVGVCLDVGHMNLPGMPRLDEAFGVLAGRIAELHLHDNRGQRDEHCWPGDGTVDWGVVREGIAGARPEAKAVLEIGYEPELLVKTVSENAAKAFRLIEA